MAESDSNLTSGESLIRQILYGEKFFNEEFGIKEQEILWLPDAFGFRCIAADHEEKRYSLLPDNKDGLE